MALTIETPIAVGELIDKITILEIKVTRFTDPDKARNAQTELSMLTARRDSTVPHSEQVAELSARLKEVNERIWELEDAIRDCERHADFGPEFVAIARRIYRTNDERAAVKRQINVVSGSGIVEEKSYAAY